MNADARAVFEACKTTTLTFDCYGTLIDWHSGACRSLRDLYGYARHDATDDALVVSFWMPKRESFEKTSFRMPKCFSALRNPWQRVCGFDRTQPWKPRLPIHCRP